MKRGRLPNYVQTTLSIKRLINRDYGSMTGYGKVEGRVASRWTEEWRRRGVVPLWERRRFTMYGYAFDSDGKRWKIRREGRSEGMRKKKEERVVSRRFECRICPIFSTFLRWIASKIICRRLVSYSSLDCFYRIPTPFVAFPQFHFV